MVEDTVSATGGILGKKSGFTENILWTQMDRLYGRMLPYLREAAHQSSPLHEQMAERTQTK